MRYLKAAGLALLLAATVGVVSSHVFAQAASRLFGTLPTNLTTGVSTPLTCTQNGSGCILDVNVTSGGGTLTFPILAPDGTEAAPSYAFSGAPATGMYKTGNSLVLASTAGDVIVQKQGVNYCATHGDFGWNCLSVRAGGFYEGVSSPTTSQAVDSQNSTFLCNATSGVVTVTLPPPSLNAGRVVTLKKTDASANACRLAANASETLDGAALPFELGGQWDSVTVVSNGTNWFNKNRSGGTLFWERANTPNAADTNWVASTAYSLPANTLSLDGDRVDVELVVSLSSAASSKSYACAVGSTFSAAGGFTGGQSILSSSTATAGPLTITARGVFTRFSATQISVYANNWFTSGSMQGTAYSSGSMTATAANTIQCAVKDAASTAAAITINEVRFDYRPR